MTFLFKGCWLTLKDNRFLTQLLCALAISISVPGKQVSAQPYGPIENYGGFSTISAIATPASGVDIGVILPFDFNYDGRDDLLLTQFYNPLIDAPLPIKIYLNTQTGWIDGTSSVFHGTPTQLVSANGFLIRDFNGDGKDDIWLTVYGYDAGNAPGDQNRLILSRPDNKFEDVSATNLPTLDDTTHSAAAGDINGDGAIDIFVGNIFGENQIPPYFLINNGSGSFTRDDSMIPAAVNSLDRRYTTSLIQDVNFDGKNDLILGFHSGSDLQHRIWLGNGDGTFTETLLGALPSGYSDTPYVTSGDLNRDGNPDILFSVTSSDYKDAGIQVFLGRGDGSFIEHSYANSPYVSNDPGGNVAWVYEMHLANLNTGDCKPDIIARRLGAPLYLQNTGLLQYSFRTEVIGTSQHFQYFDGDGDGGWDFYYMNPAENPAARIKTQTSTPACDVKLEAAILPNSRSVQVGQTATMFATVVNAGASDGNNCHPAFGSPISGTFFYQATNPATNALISTPNTPINIPAGQLQSFLIGFTPNEEMSPREMRFGFFCENSADSAPVRRGVNTASLGASNTATADILAIASTVGNPGIIEMTGDQGNGFFATAGINIGAAATLQITPVLTGVQGSAVVAICETDVIGTCIGSLQSSLTLSFATNQSRTFSIFISANGQTIPRELGANRIRLEFKETGGSGALRGAASVAVTTQP